MAFERESSKVFLMGPESLFTPINRCFNGRTCGGDGGVDASLPLLELNYLALNNPLDVLSNEWAAGKIHSACIVPERVELLLHPGHRRWIVVFPQELIVHFPGSRALVDTT